MIGLLFAAGASAAQLFEAVEPHMGTLVKIKLYARNPAQASIAFRAAFERIRELDEALSDYKPDSELNRLCSRPAGRPVRAGVDLFRVLAAAQQLSDESDGAFDVTLGPLIRVWRGARRQGRVPDAEALQAAEARCGYRNLHLDPATRMVILDHDGMQLDLGGIAKGYAADEALEEIGKLGIRSALVAISGDLAFSDAPPGQRGWRIGAGGTEEILVLHNAAVSTSGDEEQHLDAGGKRYSHILDPVTGSGITSGIVVTIVAPSGMEADGLATAVSVLGSERGRALVRRHTGASLFVREKVE